jgi:hypothetical protein
MSKRIELPNPIFEHGIQFQRALRHQLSKFDVEKECTFPSVLKAWISTLRVYNGWPVENTWLACRTFNQSVSGVYFSVVRLDLIFQVWVSRHLIYIPYYAGISLRTPTDQPPFLSTHAVEGSVDLMEYGATLADRYRQHSKASDTWRRILHASFYDTSPLEVEMPALWPASDSNIDGLGDES